MTTKARRLRELLASGDLLVTPGIYDGYSARLAEAAGYAAAATSGAAVSNSILGIDDIGIMGLAENVEHCRRLARVLNIPLTADADTGYGSPVNVYHTTQMFEEAGVAGINIEDQVHPKRCGHMPGKEVVPPTEMVKKIEAACRARRDDDFMIIARTDALAIEGLDSTIARIRLYVQAGADMIFPDAVRAEEDIKRIVDAAGVPVTVNMGFGIRRRPTTPLLSIPQLARLGVRRVSLPRMLPAAAIMGMRQALALMQESARTGEIMDRPDLLAGIEDIMALMDYENMAKLEASLLSTEDMQKKYGKAVRDTSVAASAEHRQ